MNGTGRSRQNQAMANEANRTTPEQNHQILANENERIQTAARDHQTVTVWCDHPAQVKDEQIELLETHLSLMHRRQQAWQDFMEQGKEPDPQLISSEILCSWKRCLSKGLDPRHIHPCPIPSDELKRRMEENQELIEAATPLFESFMKQFHDPLFTLDLYDKDLCFIKSYGLAGNPLRLSRGYADPGLRRDETACGTTAMSMAHQLKKPVCLTGAEHFDHSLHSLACSAVPIFGIDGALIGVINMVEDCMRKNDRTLETMAALSKGVEYNLRQLHGKRQLEVTNSFNQAIIESMNEAMIVIDSLGKVTLANHAALRLLHLTWNEINNQEAETLFGSANPFLQVLSDNHPMVEKEILLTLPGGVKRCMGTIRPITSDYAKIHGVIGTLRDMDAARKIMKNFGGWNASFTFDNIIGRDPLLLQTIQLARQTASLGSNTLIQGESGTGKEIFAHAIHNASRFKTGPFVAVNCAAIPLGLLESELFGYESGAYTGAKKNGQPGKFELAEGGTIFLDEINSMPLDIQAKILRVVQDKKISRLGGNSSITLHLKLIAACNTDLNGLVASGLFRSDLYYRLNVITVQLPPLRQRISDIPLLVDYILERMRTSAQRNLSVGSGVLELLAQYSWPGNVRELENVLERGFVNASLRGSNTIETADLHRFLDTSEQNASDAVGTMTSDTAGLPPSSRTEQKIPDIDDLKTADAAHLKAWEEAAIKKSLENWRGNVSKAAKELGISRNTLYRKMKEYRIGSQI